MLDSTMNYAKWINALGVNETSLAKAVAAIAGKGVKHIPFHNKEICGYYNISSIPSIYKPLEKHSMTTLSTGAKGGNKSEKSEKSETIVKTLNFSQQFKDALDHLFIVSYMPFKADYVSNDTPDGNNVSVNDETRKWLERELFAEPLNATFAFAVRNCTENDWKLAGVETPAMRQKRIDKANLEKQALENAVKLATNNGYRIIPDEYASMFAAFIAHVELRHAEQSTMASMQALENMLVTERHNDRLRKIQAYLAERENRKAKISLCNQITATSENQAFDADARITAAMAEANKALLEKQAAEKQAAEMQAQLAAMQAQLAQLIAAQAQAQPQPQPKSKAKANATA